MLAYGFNIVDFRNIMHVSIGCSGNYFYNTVLKQTYPFFLVGGSGFTSTTSKPYMLN
jgi:hypothetical protein